MNVPSTDKVMSIAMLIGIVIVLFIVYKILAATGLIKTQEQKKLAEEKSVAEVTLLGNDYFNPKLFHDRLNKYRSLGLKGANQEAAKLHDAIFRFGTDEAKIFSVFLNLFCKVNISEISAAYQVNYNSDLKLDLVDELNKTDMAKLVDIINKLPNQ